MMPMIRLRSTEVTGRPIQSWPGEFTTDRTSARFKASWSATIDLLDRELWHLKAQNVVLQLAMQEADFRLDGAPRASARASHPGVILSLDSPYGPLSYPCDTYLTWQDNLRAIALALEALRKVDRYGVTKRGEQYTGWRQLGSGPTTSQEEAAHWVRNIAGGDFLDRMTSRQIIEDRDLRTAALRAAAKKAHPDAGGSSEQFQRLQAAKRVLEGA